MSAGSLEGGSDDRVRIERLRKAGSAGHLGQKDVGRQALLDSTPKVRAAGLGALKKMGQLEIADLIKGLSDPSEIVRRRSGETAAFFEASTMSETLNRSLDDALIKALDDDDALSVEAAIWALGERKATQGLDKIHLLVANHPDTRCREAGVAALGNMGDKASLSVLLGALGDKPTVRRRAAVALAAFDGPEAQAGLEQCLVDRDWQVREVAEILLER